MRIWLIAKIGRMARNFLKSPIVYSSSCITKLTFIIREKRLGIETYGYYVPNDNIGLYGDAKAHATTSYSRLMKMFNYLKLNKEDVFIDLGCGVGRPIFVAGTKRLKKAVGIEIRKELADIAKWNLKNLKLNNTPIEIINADVAALDILDIKEGTVFFLFNPFGEKTFTRVVENIKKSLVVNPRKVRIVYYGSVYKDLLNSQDWLVPEGEIDKTDIFVWHTQKHADGRFPFYSGNCP